MHHVNTIRTLTSNRRPPLLGFTLIELLIVIAIIGLLATLAVFAVANARQQARDAKRVADVKQIQNALDLYATANGGYPNNGAIFEIGAGAIDCLVHGEGFSDDCDGDPTVYMQVLPSNPTPGGAPYEYESLLCAGTAVCQNYQIHYTLEGGAGGLGAGTHFACNSGIDCPGV